jgi:uncharacterized membrane protein YeaQ/YmgE (transglycosylase-associated protein family)
MRWDGSIAQKEHTVGILGWIVVGLIGGAIGKLLMPGKDPGGIITTILLGIAGAMLGGFIAVALDISDGVDDFDIGSIVLAALGTMLILFVYRLIASRA